MKIFHSTVATAAQLAVHKDSSGFEGNLIGQRHSCRFCLETCSCRLTTEPLRGDSVSSATRTTGERSLQPQIHLLHLPQHLSRLEARKTDNDNAKQQKRKIEDNINCLQPLACAQASHSVFGGGKAGFPLTRMEPSLSSTKQAPFFHCTIARLAAAHTFLMAEISRHALTDLSGLETVHPVTAGQSPAYDFSVSDEQKGVFLVSVSDCSECKSYAGG